MMDDVLLNQRGNLAGATGLNVLRLTLMMLQVLPRLRNNTLYPFCIFFPSEGWRPVAGNRDGLFFSLKSTTAHCFLRDAFVKSGNKVFASIAPKVLDEMSFVSVQAAPVIVLSNLLARSIEYFLIPRDVLTICVGSRTMFAGESQVNLTPFEPEWGDL